MVALDFPDAPTDGQDFGVWEWSDSVDAWRWNVVPSPYDFEYLVVAGGGGVLAIPLTTRHCDCALRQE